MKHLFCALFVILTPVLAHSYDPLPGQELVPRLQHSQLLIPGGITTPMSTGATSAGNPAAIALQQRIRLFGGYTGIVGSGEIAGHAAAAGVTVPTRAGVFGGSLGVVSVEEDALNLGTRTTVHLQGAKELFPRWLAGAGITTTITDQAGVRPLGIGLDLGAVHQYGPMGPLQDVQIGIALRQLGIGPPAPFTVAADIHGEILNRDTFRAAVGLGLEAPSFQNGLLRIHSDLTFFDRFTLTAGWHVNLREHTDGGITAGSLVPAVGLSARFATDGARRPVEYTATTAYAPLYPGIWAGSVGLTAALGVIDETPPRVSFTYPEPLWISPNNDGLADELLLPLEITDEGQVMYWALVIQDLSGNPVRRIENAELRPENIGFRNIIDRILYVRTGVDIPETVRWDGRSDAGEVVPDGEYRFFIEAEDDNENRRVSPLQTIFVDTEPPQIVIFPPEDPDDLIFSPDGDGQKDTISIVQEGSQEDVWEITILDATDTVVRQVLLEDTVLESFTWDGRDDDGVVVPDGVYTYQVSATDRALNTSTERVSNIIVDTRPTPVGLAVDVSHFSPNNNGRRDTITFTPDVPVPGGIRSHVLEIRDAQGAVRRTFSGGETVPAEWIFDGRSGDGALLPEGPYTAVFRVLYRNGNEPEAVSPPWVLDITPPRVAVIAEDTIFSPNNDGRKDTITFLQEGEEAVVWEGRIERPTGEIIRTITWGSQPAARLQWDGRTDSGARAPDGRYRYTLTGEDRAGNRGVSTPITFELDTRETPLFITPGRSAFAPGTTGPHPVMTLNLEIPDPRGIERYTIEILDQNDAVVARIAGENQPDQRIPWDGRDAGGRIAVDGTYRARATLTYRHGNQPVSVSQPFEVDTIPPTAQVSLPDPDRAFSPDGDGLKDTIEIRQSSSEEELWTARIERVGDNAVMREWNVRGRLTPLVWDGTDGDGEVVPDGTYRYVVESTDAAGNSTRVTSPTFRSDTREVEVRLRLSRRAFRDTVDFIPESNITEGVNRWELRILNDQEEVVRTFTRQGPLEPVTWNGANVPDGEYRGEITVEYVTGANPTVRTTGTVLLDRVPPRAQVSLSTDIISPNGDGRLDEVVITQDTSEEDRWTGTLRNAAGDVVRTWDWAGRAEEEVVFRGVDMQQRRLPDGIYRYEVTAIDAAGNAGTSGVHTFEIYTAETPLTLDADLTAFSPNGDGVQDRVTFTPTIGDARGLQRWNFTVRRTTTGEAVFERSGTTSLPATLVWDGRQQNAVAPEGTYRGELVLEYRHGNRPEARTTPILLDITPPELTISASHTIFAPGPDNRRNSIEIQQRTGVAQEWRGEIRRPDGTAVRTFTWPTRAAALTWDGTDEAGNILPDGVYQYHISGTDSAGNTATARIESIEIDTAERRLFITINRRLFAPGVTGTELPDVEISLIAGNTTGGRSRVVEVLDQNDTVVRRFTATEVQSRERILWDGRTTDGRIVDGQYRIRYAAAFTNGMLPETLSPTVRVDTTAPTLAVNLEGLPFSPDNDGINDELGIRLHAEDESGIASWSFEILDRNRRVFQRFAGTGQPRDRIIWDGRGTAGQLVVSAEDYPYRFTATDRAGNRRVTAGVIPIDILVVRDGDRLRIQISNINFQPNSPMLQLDPDTPEGAKNLEVLNRLTEIFQRYQTYQVRAEGHAVALLGTEFEETRTLQPLSQARAQSVRTALIERGLEPGRITAVGRGGLEPLVPHSDAENRWQNRRVEFILIR